MLHIVHCLSSRPERMHCSLQDHSARFGLTQVNPGPSSGSGDAGDEADAEGGERVYLTAWKRCNAVARGEATKRDNEIPSALGLLEAVGETRVS